MVAACIDGDQDLLTKLAQADEDHAQFSDEGSEDSEDSKADGGLDETAKTSASSEQETVEEEDVVKQLGEVQLGEGGTSDEAEMETKTRSTETVRAARATLKMKPSQRMQQSNQRFLSAGAGASAGAGSGTIVQGLKKAKSRRDLREQFGKDKDT